VRGYCDEVFCHFADMRNALGACVAAVERGSCPKINNSEFRRSCVGLRKRTWSAHASYISNLWKGSHGPRAYGHHRRRARVLRNSTNCADHAIEVTRTNADAAFKLAKDVANAKDFQELVTLQTRYVQAQMRWYAQQAQEFGRLMGRAVASSQPHASPASQAARSDAGDDKNPGDEAKPGTPGTGENVCAQCRGTGKIQGKTCPNCGGTGKIVEGIGGG
jgi:phasin protein